MTDVEFDTTKFKHSTLVLILWIAVATFGGYLVGWFANESNDARLYCTIISVVFLYAIKHAKVSYVNNLTAYSELVRLHRDDEVALGKQYCENLKENAVSQMEYPFTSEDFDPEAQDYLQPFVDAARKKKRVVTAAEMLKAVFKGMR